MLTEVMNNGAFGIEIKISGKDPSARAKSWRFYSGYLKKSGDISNEVRKANKQAMLKTGIIGVKVSIMPSDIKLPDNIKLVDYIETKVEEIKEEKPQITETKEKKEKPKRRKKKEDESKGTQTNE